MRFPRGTAVDDNDGPDPDLDYCTPGAQITETGMTLEDWLRTEADLRSEPGMRVGMADDRSHASMMTWSSKRPGTWFWEVRDGNVRLIQFVGNDD